MERGRVRRWRRRGLTNSFGNVTFLMSRAEYLHHDNGRVKGSSLTGNSATIRDSFGDIELDAVSGTW